MISADAPQWAREGCNWPNRATSSFVVAGGLRWHVQMAGEGPVLLLLHGTAGATHSWADLLPILAGRFRVVAPDLPGHGFTAAPAPSGLSLDGMARLVKALLEALHITPAAIVGHSAGAAIALEMCLRGFVTPRLIISLNGALLPFGGIAGQVFAPMAQVMVRLPMVPWLLAQQAQDQRVVARILQGTGSRLKPETLGHYGSLLKTRRHLTSALQMMAGWNLQALKERLPQLRVPVLLIVGERDGFVPPGRTQEMKRLLPRAEVHLLPGLGHLAHEEQPERVADVIFDALRALRLPVEPRAA